MEEATSLSTEEPKIDQTQKSQEVHGSDAESSSATSGVHTDTYKEGNKLIRPINCPYCPFSTVYPNCFSRHMKTCSQITDEVRSILLEPSTGEDGGVEGSGGEGPSLTEPSPTNSKPNQVSSLNSEIGQQQPPVFNPIPNVVNEVQVIGANVQESQVTTTPPVKRRRKKKIVDQSPSELNGSEMETPHQLNSRPNVSLLITSHCTKCPLCNFTTKYHFNIARHLYCKHKEDYALLSEGKKSLEGIRLKEPGTIQRTSPKPFRPRRSKNDSENGPPRKRGRPSTLEEESVATFGNGGFPPVLVQQPQIMTETGHDLHQFCQDIPLPILDRYPSDLDMNTDFLNQLTEPGSSSILQTALEWDAYLQPLNQQLTGSSSMPTNLPVFLESNNNDLTNLSIPMDGTSQMTDHSLQNSFMPSLSSSSSSSSTLPPISVFKNFPSILSQRLQEGGVEQQQNEGRFMSVEQLETRKREVREKAKERRKEKLMPVAMPGVANGAVRNESSLGQFDNIFPVISVPSTSPPSRPVNESPSLPDRQEDGPAQSNGSRIKKKYNTMKNYTLSHDEKERMRKQRLRALRQNYYLKKKQSEQEKLIRELPSMDPETREMHEKKLEKWRRNYEKKLERERLQYEQMNNRIGVNNTAYENDGNTLTLSTSSLQEQDRTLAQYNGAQRDDEANQSTWQREKDKEYRKNYNAMRKKRKSEEIEQRRQFLLQDIQTNNSPDDHSYFVPTSSGTDFSMYQPPPGERKKRKNKKIVERRLSIEGESNGSDKSWDGENRDNVTKSNMIDDENSLEGRQKRRRASRDDATFDHVVDDSDWVEDDEYSDADLTTDFSDNEEVSTGPREQMFIDTGPKLHTCNLCEFSTPHGFNLLIHTQIHEIIAVLPDFFLSLLQAGGNLKRLLSEEPDVARANKYFIEAGMDRPPIVDMNCHESMATVS